VAAALVRDHEDLRPEFESRVADWLRSGRITARETVTDGLDSAAQTLLALLDGGNVGKRSVQLFPGLRARTAVSGPGESNETTGDAVDPPADRNGSHLPQIFR
jgi:hypothetical protein